MKMTIKAILFYVGTLLSMEKYVKAELAKHIPIQETSNNLLPVIDKLLHCFEGRKKNSILLINDEEESSVIFNVFFAEYVPLYLFQNEQKDIFKKHKRFVYYKLKESHVQKINYPITSATIVESNTTIFFKLLTDLRNSIWWNNQAYLLIINRNYKNSCQTADEFLNIVWAFNILFAIYLCLKSNNETQLYTFNPYANLAPKFWNKVYNISTITSSHWTLFRLTTKYFDSLMHGDATLRQCDLFFDKSNNFNGYNLKAVLPIESDTDLKKKIKSGYNGFQNGAFQIIFIILNRINATVTVKQTMLNIHSINELGEAIGPLKDLSSGEVDLSMEFYLLRDFWRMQAHSFFFSNWKFVSLRDLKSASKLNAKFILETWGLLFIVCLIFTIIPKIFLRQSVPVSALNIIRIFFNQSLSKEPWNSAMEKLLFITCICVAFVYSSSIHSCLTVIKTKIGQFPSIKTIADLLNSDLKIYGFTSHKDLISKYIFEKIKHRFLPITDPVTCLNRLLEGEHIICLVPEMDANKFMKKSAFIRVSKENIFTARSLAMILKEESPLVSKFQMFLMMMNEGGLIKSFFNKRSTNNTIHNYNGNHFVKAQNKEFTALYLILMVAWILGIIVLCIEIFIRKVKNCNHIIKAIIKFRKNVDHKHR